MTSFALHICSTKMELSRHSWSKQQHCIQYICSTAVSLENNLEPDESKILYTTPKTRNCHLLLSRETNGHQPVLPTAQWECDYFKAARKWHLREDAVCRKLTLHMQQKAQPTETKPRNFHQELQKLWALAYGASPTSSENTMLLHPQRNASPLLSSSLLCSPSRELNISLHCCGPHFNLQPLTEGWKNCHNLQLCQETISMRTGPSLTAHSSPKKGASSWWGDFLLSSHWQRQSIPGQRFKDKAAL